MADMDLAHSTKRKGRLRSACQVEGCTNLLPTATLYHRRYHICLEHATLPSMMLNGKLVRFCQQCGRFQPLGEFDASRRSCRRKLLMHNVQRKRARDAAKEAETCDTSPTNSPRSSTATTFRLRPLRRAAPARSHETRPDPLNSEPATPACRPSFMTCCGPAPVVTVTAPEDTAFVTLKTLEKNVSVHKIDDLDIEELLHSWDDGSSAEVGLCSFSGMLGGSMSIPPPPAALSQPHTSATVPQAALPAYPGSPLLAVPPANIDTLLRPAALLPSPFFLATMPVSGSHHQLMPVMPLMPVAAPAMPPIAPPATTLPAEAKEQAVLVPTETKAQIFRKPVP